MQSSLVREPTNLTGSGEGRWPASAASSSPPVLPFRSAWGPKARRWYQRLLSGVTHHQANRRRLRVITLTSAPRAAGLDINKSFQVLKQRLRRRYQVAGFEYWKLKTSEGHGVLHIIYAGAYIPQAYLSRLWQEIHLSPVVYIQELRRRRKKLISYLMTHYLPAHDTWKLYTRMSWSWGWVFRGFCGAWRWFWRRGPTMYEAIIDWNKMMKRGDPGTSYKRMRGTLYTSTKLTSWMF